ncbi:MAG: hypothetical protein HKN41_07860 [Ilumatobacter sp.]|nr:hypothetical protein [Ilumatobacter sp.]
MATETAARTGAADTDVDERFRALLEGIRTSLPGVQVLFAFLLTAPLQSRFSDLSTNEKVWFAIAFYSSGLASVLLIAPSVHQRFRAPVSGLKRQSHTHLMIATWVTIVGTVAMGVAIFATTFLVSLIVFGDTVAATATALLAAATVWSWAYLPLVTFPKTSDSGS